MLKKIISATNPLMKHRRHISPIWFLPFVALIIGVWLVWRTLLDTGPTVYVEFESSEGIVADQTQIRYKGISFGIVTDINPKSDLSGVVATIELDKNMLKKNREHGFPKDTKIWLVKPQISLSGVSGLNALVSGNYITALLGTSDELTTHFTAVKNAPLDFKEPGLHLTLNAKSLSSLSQGSPVYYRKLYVGEVKGYSLNPTTHYLDINVLILPEYEHLINNSTRFWNASGLSVNASLTGITLQTESVATLLNGGIVFDTPDSTSEQPVEDGHTFKLFDNESSAGATVAATILFPNADYLIADQTEIRYQGLVVGVVNHVAPHQDGKGVVAEVSVKPDVEPLLREDTQFWLVQPEISAAKVTGLSALAGAYISFYPGQGKPSREFTASLSVPPLPESTPGLHLTLESDDSAGITVGSPVLYKKIEVGSVQGIRFSPDKTKVQLQIFILPDYAKQVSTATRFWNASGITVNGNLSNIKVNTGSLASILQGGVMFDQFSKERHQLAKNGDRFTLYAARDDALNAGITVELHLQSATGLSIGSEIRHRGLKVGEITHLQLNKQLDGVTAFAAMNSNAASLLNTETTWWQVEPEFGLARTANLGTLIGGSYLALRPGNGTPTTVFDVHEVEPTETMKPTGLNLTLTAERAGSLKAGNPILYRQVRIGSVLGIDLSPSSTGVRIYININETHAKLIHQNSRFVNVSGVSVNAGLFSGMQINTESLETIIAGGIALEEDSGNAGEPIKQGAQFELHEK